MGLDIKLPIGLMFTVLGILLTIKGFISIGDKIYLIKSLGYNINLWSGLAMLIFGLIMLLLSFLSSKKRTGKKDQA
jgi:hypothetical protein